MSNFNFASGGEVIARVDTYFTIDFSDWITLAPLMILDGLLELGTPMVFEQQKVDIEVEDYAATLPVNIAGLDMVMYNGKRLSHISTLITKTDDANTGYVNPYYTHRNGNTITTSFESGTITVYYKVLPTELVPEFGVNLPKVPNNIHVFNALGNYIMRALIIKGYKHPTLNLQENNPWLNPGLAFEKHAKAARNSLGAMTYDQRIELSKLQHEFVANYNYPNTEDLGHLSGITETP